MIPKPSRLDRDVAKWAARVAKAAKRNADVRAAKAAWTKRSRECKARDGGICQACGIVTNTTGTNTDPRTWGAAHHKTFKSAGGTDDLENLEWLCNKDHALRHGLKVSAK